MPAEKNLTLVTSQHNNHNAENRWLWVIRLLARDFEEEAIA